MRNLGEWVWLLAFFPLWIVMAGVWFGFASIPKKVVGGRTQALLNNTAFALSLCSAMAILVGLNCGGFIQLPFADQACHASNYQLEALSVF